MSRAIPEKDTAAAQRRMPHITDDIQMIVPHPHKNQLSSAATWTSKPRGRMHANMTGESTYYRKHVHYGGNGM